MHAFSTARPSDGDLPFVDAHETAVDAPREVVWSALRAWVEESFVGANGGVLNRLLGTHPPAGFAVAGMVPLRRIRLTGRHRFARYALVFELGDDGEQTLLRATTYAAFPGPHGRVYRALLMGTHAHVMVTRRLLDKIRDASLAAR